MDTPSGNRQLEGMPTCNVCCAWIAPDGTRYHLSSKPGEGSHSGLARAIGDDRGGHGLDNQGFLHLSYGDAFMGDGRHTPTQAQLDALFDIGTELTNRGSYYGDYIMEFIEKWQEQVLQEAV